MHGVTRLSEGVVVQGYVKTRDRALPGSIPAALGAFEAEVRLYREIAPTVGVRVPGCYQAEIRPDGSTWIVAAAVRL